MSLRLAIESELLEPELPKLLSPPGSLARKEEALAAVRERKRQQEAGEIPKKVPYEEVNKAYNIRGAVIESFAYYKQKFKEALYKKTSHLGMVCTLPRPIYPWVRYLAITMIFFAMLARCMFY